MTMIDRTTIAGSTLPATLAAAACLALWTGPARGQSAGEVLRTAMERYGQRMEGIENYTVVLATNGSETTLYFERVASESGPPRFRAVTQGYDLETASAGAMGEAMAGGGGEAALGAADPYAMFDELAPRAELRGTEDVDGREAYVIAVDDLSEVDFGAVTGSRDGAESFRPGSMTLWIDTDRFVALRSSITGTLEMEGRSAEITLDARMDDYREVEGMLHPFRTDVSMDGLGGAMSAEQREQIRRAREQMESQLEGMSEEQRAMVEGMMEERMPDTEALAGGTTTMAMEVRELRVNEGPPEDMEAAAEREARMAEARERRAAEPGEEARRERRTPVERPSQVDPSEYEPQFPQYHGVYKSSERENRSFFVSETCEGSLAMGAMWGDVSPWVFEQVSESEFHAPPISPGAPDMRVRFETGPGGARILTILSEGWEDYGTLTLSEALPERWGHCMQQRR